MSPQFGVPTPRRKRMDSEQLSRGLVYFALGAITTLVVALFLIWFIKSLGGFG